MSDTQYIGAKVLDKFATIPQDVSGEVIATADGKPIWISAVEAGLRYDTCWVSRPWIKIGDCVFHHLGASRFLNLLPLLEWFRLISDWPKWEQPPLRACFMFDDPNLHATRYGFVKYDHLAAEGRRNHYHTAFATVPLDSYYVSDAAARIIQNNSQVLSLLVHGNNHSYRELAGRQAPEEQLAQMRQAINCQSIEKIALVLPIDRACESSCNDSPSLGPRGNSGPS